MRAHRRRIIRFLIVLAVITCCLWLTAHFSAQQSSWKPSTLLGLHDDAWEYYVPKNNPMTPAKMELGRKLFFDRRPSAEGRVSCSSWHDSKFALTDSRAVSERDLKEGAADSWAALFVERRAVAAR